MRKYDVAARSSIVHEMIEGSTLSQEIKDNARLLHHYNLAALAIAKKDFVAAKSQLKNIAKELKLRRIPRK